jgi:hypothetical protein
VCAALAPPVSDSFGPVTSLSVCLLTRRWCNNGSWADMRCFNDWRCVEKRDAGVALRGYEVEMHYLTTAFVPPHKPVRAPTNRTRTRTTAHATCFISDAMSLLSLGRRERQTTHRNSSARTHSLCFRGLL